SASIPQLIRHYPDASCRALSAKLSEAWPWKQANGEPRDMIRRGLLLMLDRAGEIESQPVRYPPPNPLANRDPPEPIDTTPIHGPLSPIQPHVFQQVRRTADELLLRPEGT